jgi:hypothetical protein
MGVVVLVAVDGSHFEALEFIRSYYMVLGGMLDNTFALRIIIVIIKEQEGKQ